MLLADFGGMILVDLLRMLSVVESICKLDSWTVGRGILKAVCMLNCFSLHFGKFRSRHFWHNQSPSSSSQHYNRMHFFVVVAYSSLCSSSFFTLQHYSLKATNTYKNKYAGKIKVDKIPAKRKHTKTQQQQQQQQKKEQKNNPRKKMHSKKTKTKTKRWLLKFKKQLPWPPTQNKTKTLCEKKRIKKQKA